MKQVVRLARGQSLPHGRTDGSDPDDLVLHYRCNYEDGPGKPL